MIWLVLTLLSISGLIIWRHLVLRKKEDVLLCRLDAVVAKQIKTSNELASIRVKHGQTWETFVPLMQTFEEQLGPKENAVFLGQPIDLIYFNNDEVIFVEVKTGNSKLSSRQRHIKSLIKGKKIRWMEVNDSLRSALLDTDPRKWAAMMTTVPHRKPSSKNSVESFGN